LIGLLSFRQVDHLHRYPALQLTGYFSGWLCVRAVAIEHQGHPVEVVGQLLSLRFGKGVSH
jgi:hypothetical protein